LSTKEELLGYVERYKAQRDDFVRIVKKLDDAGVDFVVGGGHAFHDRLKVPFLTYSGDMDLFVSLVAVLAVVSCVVM